MKAYPRSLAVVLFCIATFFGVSTSRAQSVSVSASPTTITNEGEESTITFTVSPPSSRNLSINIALTGTAALGSDYALIGDFNRSGQLVIPAGQSSATVTLHSLYDDDPRFNEYAVVYVLGGKRYRVGSPSHAQVTIENVP